MSYEVVGVRPDGIVGLRLTCATRERADLFANMCRLQHPDWKVSVRQPSGSNPMIEIVRPDAGPPAS